jgi:hypothetical protein
MTFFVFWWSLMGAASLLIARDMRCNNSRFFIVLAIACFAVAYFCIP